jgi:hypothetical protein
MCAISLLADVQNKCRRVSKTTERSLLARSTKTSQGLPEGAAIKTRLKDAHSIAQAEGLGAVQRPNISPRPKGPQPPSRRHGLVAWSPEKRRASGSADLIPCPLPPGF